MFKRIFKGKKRVDKGSGFEYIRARVKLYIKPDLINYIDSDSIWVKTFKLEVTTDE